MGIMRNALIIKYLIANIYILNRIENKAQKKNRRD